LSRYQHLQETLIRNIGDIITEINVLLPSTQTPRTGRLTKRSLLPFVGSIFSSLFGTSTEDELQQRKSHMKDVELLTKQMAGVLSKNTEKLTSFMTLANT
jgi:hypothetical protein